MSIGDLRQRTGLTQAAFAEHFGIPVRTLQQWEQGRSKPAPYVLELIEQALEQRSSLDLAGAQSGDIYELSMPAKSVWRTCIERPFTNVNRIYPLQQRKVQELLQDLSDCPEVQEVVVFGSSVTPQCHMGSDVDIYVVLARDINPIDEAHDFAFDLWTNYTVTPRLLEEIEKKGVKVYG